jgi:hypothetical protein
METEPLERTLELAKHVLGSLESQPLRHIPSSCVFEQSDNHISHPRVGPPLSDGRGGTELHQGIVRRAGGEFLV